MSYYDYYGPEDATDATDAAPEVAADQEVQYEHVGTSKWFMLLPIWNLSVISELYNMTKVGTYDDGAYTQYWIPIAYVSTNNVILLWGMWQNSKAEYYWPHLKKMYLFALFQQFTNMTVTDTFATNKGRWEGFAYDWGSGNE